MSKEVFEWSTDLMTNSFAPADGGAAENWTGKDVNNAARERMRAFATFYRAQEFARTMFNETPYGAKAVTRNSNTQFQYNGADYTALFPAGTRIRAYQSASVFVDVFVQTATLVAGNTVVDVRGGPALPGAIIDIGFSTNPSLTPFVYGGSGTFAARDAKFGTVSFPSGILWLNTTGGAADLEVSYLNAWNVIGHVGMLTAGAASMLLNAVAGAQITLQYNGVSRFNVFADATLSRIKHFNAAAALRGQLDLDDDGNLYYTKLGGTRRQINSELHPQYGLVQRLVGRLSADVNVANGTFGYSVGTIFPGMLVTLPDGILPPSGAAFDNTNSVVRVGIRSAAGTSTMRVGIFQRPAGGAIDPAVDTMLNEVRIDTNCDMEYYVDNALSLVAGGRLYAAYRMDGGTGPVVRGVNTTYTNPGPTIPANVVVPVSYIELMPRGY